MTTRAKQLQEYLAAALAGGRSAGQPLRPIDTKSPVVNPPRWTSGIRGLDELTGGGFSGCSLVAGPPKSSKSQVALRSSVDAARQGWTVFHLDAELDDNEIRRRLFRIVGSDPVQWPAWMDRWRPWKPERYASLSDVVSLLYGEMREESGRLLLVIDSVNRLAKNIVDTDRREAVAGRRPSRDYFQALQEVVSFSTKLVEVSHGEFGVLLVSEVNRSGEPVGLDIEYAFSGQLLEIRPSKYPGVVKLDLRSRNTAGGKLGHHVIDHGNCRLVSNELDVEDDGKGSLTVRPAGGRLQ